MKDNSKQGKRANFPRLLSGNICLDFINSIDMRSGTSPVDYITSYQDLIAWGEHVWLLHDAQIDRLAERAARESEAAAAVFQGSIELREALHRIFRSVAHDQAAQAEDMHLLKHYYLQALTHAALGRADAEYRWQWREDQTALDRILWPVAFAAIELLCSPMLARVKECPGADDCGWLFIDTSKNGTRRWCSMEGCGSRVKMRRQYARKHHRE
jgi:predicted RNA-binding Zn ribbon-like protein